MRAIASFLVILHSAFPSSGVGPRGLDPPKNGSNIVFDTGHHFDLTRRVLVAKGFHPAMQDFVVAANWMPDLYATYPMILGWGTDEAQEASTLLHFDNLFTTSDVSNYWQRLALNTRTAVQAMASAETDPLQALVILGASLHAVQDFYTHSNWVDIFPRRPDGSYLTVTWFDSPVDGSQHVYTGEYRDEESEYIGHVRHGGYFSGMNKDSYIRAKWDEAYVFAYAASRQWVDAVEVWVNEVDPAYWRKMRESTLEASVHDDTRDVLRTAQIVSMWVVDADAVTCSLVVLEATSYSYCGQDGHWKGNGSGSASALAAYVVTGDAAQYSRVADVYDDVYHFLVIGLENHVGFTDPDPITLPHVALDERAVIVRTTQAQDLNGVLGSADLYAKITVDGDEFIEATQQDDDWINPKWTTIQFVDCEKVAIDIRYTLWDEDVSSDLQLVISGTNRDYVMRFMPVLGPVQWMTEGTDSFFRYGNNGKVVFSVEAQLLMDRSGGIVVSPCTFGSLAYTVWDAAAGETLFLTAGTYPGPITIQKALTLRARGDGTVTIGR